MNTHLVMGDFRGALQQCIPIVCSYDHIYPANHPMIGMPMTLTKGRAAVTCMALCRVAALYTSRPLRERGRYDSGKGMAHVWTLSFWLWTRSLRLIMRGYVVLHRKANELLAITHGSKSDMVELLADKLK